MTTPKEKAMKHSENNFNEDFVNKEDIESNQWDDRYINENDWSNHILEAIDIALKEQEKELYIELKHRDDIIIKQKQQELEFLKNFIWIKYKQDIEVSRLAVKERIKQLEALNNEKN